MELLVPILLVCMFAAIGFGAYTIMQKLSQVADGSKGDAQALSMLQNQIQDQAKIVRELSQLVDHKMTATERTLHQSQRQMEDALQKRLGEANRAIVSITEKLVNVERTNKQVMEFSEQLGNLEKVLKSQKQRGNLGEAGLKLVLENILPPTSYALQYRFKSGEAVDAIIFAKEGHIPVDAKFSLENYSKLIDETDPTRKATLENEFKKDLKRRIDETSKYIKPAEGTLEFAFMFVPSEAIYYDLLVNEVGAVKINTRSLVDYAFNEKKVIIVSPTTFAAYLQTVLFGLKALQIEEDSKIIRKNVEKLQNHIAAYGSYMEKLGSSMSTTVNHYNRAYKELEKIDKDVVKITRSERQITSDIIEKPEMAVHE